MASFDSMKRIAGYRSRDRDTVQFIEVSGQGTEPSAGLVRTIEPEQLVIVGDVEINGATDARQASGEWGRIGPPRSATGPDLPIPASDDAWSRPMDDESMD